MRIGWAMAIAALVVMMPAAQVRADDAQAALEDIQKLGGEKLDIRGKTAEKASEDALAHFNKIIGLCEDFRKKYADNPLVNDALYEEGRAYQNRSRWMKTPDDDLKKAMELADQVIKADPKSEAAAKSHGLRLQYFKMTNKTDQLLAEAQALVKDCHDSKEAPLALRYIADTYEQSGKTEDAMKMYEMLAKEYPDSQQGKAAAGILASRKLKGSALDMTFKSASGEDVDTKTMKGKVVLAVFWMPGQAMSKDVLQRASATLKASGGKLAVVGVCLGSDKGQMEEDAKAAGATWPEFFDEKNKRFKNEQALKLGVRECPFAILADKTGKVRETGLVGQNLSDAIEKLLAEAGK